MLLLFACAVAILMAFPTSAQAATFTVTNSAASGAGSLRQAILDANALPGLDTVTFNVNGGGHQTIMPGDLPRISDPIVLDATTQPGYAGLPLIELTGSGFSGTTNGITLDAGNSVVRGFIINNFNLGGIGIFTNGGNVVEGNFIGTNAAGDDKRPNFGEGIRIFNSSNNRIGGPTPAQRNLISGNSGAGIAVNGTLAAGNVVQGNYIGTNRLGTIDDRELRNQRQGICLCSSNGGFSVANNVIGGSQPGEGNLVSANVMDEIRISGNATGNVVKGNRIGTNAAGTAQLHRQGNGGNGIFLDGSRDTIVGGIEPGAGNLISGQTFGPSLGGSGIYINRGSGHIIKGNFIGTDVTGSSAITNTEHGIKVFEHVSGLVIGGPESGAGNLIAFNTRAGILVSTLAFPSLPTSRNSIRGNRIHSNGELGIDLATNIGTGVTPNDHCDVDAGNDAINDLQNFPVLTEVLTDGGSVAVFGSLNSSPNAGFTIDLYGNSNVDPTGHGEGRYYIGSIQTGTSGDCSGTFRAVLPYSGSPGSVTATATDADGNTSEFSLAIVAVPGEMPSINFAPFDFDGDGKTDVSIFRPGNAEWWYLRSSDGGNSAFQFGAVSDVIVPADYTGDGKADVALYRDGSWFVLRSSDFSFYSFPFGTPTDVPMPADFDGDDRADAAVFRPSSGEWYIQRSSDNQVTVTQFGSPGDLPVAADYDGDGLADIAIYRPTLGQWWLRRTASGLVAVTFGQVGDITVPGDYTGDGKADVAVYRTSTGEWFVLRSNDFSYYSFPFGAAGDVPAPGDYDGDGKTDAAIFRDAMTWFIQSSGGGTLVIPFGVSGDHAVPSAYTRQQK